MRICFLLVLIFTCTGILKAADSTYTITGKFDKVKTGVLRIYFQENDKYKNDSSLITDGNFFFKGSIQNPTVALLILNDNMRDYLKFYLEPAKMTIMGTGDSIALLSISGSVLNDEDKILQKRMAAISKLQAAKDKLEEDAEKAKNTAVLDSLDKADFDIIKEKKKVVAQFVKDHPQSTISLMAISEYYAYYTEANEVEPLYNLLDGKIKSSKNGMDVKHMIDVYKTLAIGKTAPEIKQSAPDGSQVSLSSLRGKLVLIDFWASWCAPCRRENPNIVKLYSDFKNKGFEVLGVSYDGRKPDWEKAIKQDSLVWYQVSDLKGWQNSTAEQYYIKALPANVLLDKDGKIIAKNLFGKNLYSKISELVNNLQVSK